ncbi:hypothetical protein Hanom_Chr01g00090691 [Helianthus anomalus]
MIWFHFWTKMAIKLKPQGPRCKKFEFWTKVAKLTKPQGPKWQFTQCFVFLFSNTVFSLRNLFVIFLCFSLYLIQSRVNCHFRLCGLFTFAILGQF